jgi:hypothetical protein
MTQPRPTPAPWDADGFTTFYAAPSDADAITMIEIRAHVTEVGWDTVAFVEAIWPGAKANARLIAASPKMLDALFDIKRLAEKSGDHEADPWALLDLIAADARAAIHLAIQG